MTLPSVFQSHNGNVLDSQTVAGICLTETAYAAKLIVPKHSHRHACFCLVLQGIYTERFQRTALECKPSHLVFRPAEETHSDKFGDSKVHCFIIEFETEWLTRFHNPALILRSPAIFHDNSLIWLVMMLRRELREVDDATPMIIEAGMNELIARAWRRTAAKTSERKAPRWLKQAKEILHEQFSEHLTLSGIAETVGVHPAYLTTVFRQHYHCSIGEYLRRVRIEFACSEISTTEVPLVDIALAAGFSHQSHFSRIFKRLTGLTPAQYRLTSRSS
jgi:AraC family transcriptional regulator